MYPELERAKVILDKSFCFMEWQANDAIQAGREVMGKEDIEFLLSLQGISKDEVLFFESDKIDEYDSEKLFTVILNSKKDGLKGLVLDTTIIEQDASKLKEMGCFVRIEGHGSVFWDEVYFSEDAYIRAEISYFKNLFGGLVGVAHIL